MIPATWPEILAASEKIHWRVEDLMGPDHRFDFTRPFLPESLARVRGLDLLAPAAGTAALPPRVPTC